MNNKLIGECNYCGQAITIPIGEYPDENKKNEAATKICNCQEATCDRMLHNAYSKIEEIFLTECEEIGMKSIDRESASILDKSAEAICKDLCLSVTVCFKNGIKAVIKGNSKGELEVQRTDTSVTKKCVDDK